MLVQDTLTGALHEVPEVAGYSGYGYYGEAPDLAYYGEAVDPVGEVYDGFGNPVGFLPFLAPLAAKALPALSNLLPGIAKSLPGVGQLVSGLFPGGGAAPPIPGLPFPAPPFPGFPPGMQPPMPFSPSVPPGWMRPPVPYMGLTPRRRYMRCVTWPGPPGLVPTSAAMTPQPAQAAIVAAATAPLRRRFRRRR